MSKKSLEKSYNKLLGNVWNEFVFYIAENELTTMMSDKMVGVDKPDIFSKVYIVDKMLGPIVYKEEFSHKVISKKAKLDENIFLLLKLKRKLDNQEFNFLLDNYFKDAEACFVITNWIQSDIDTKPPKQINNTFKGVFRLQYSAYKEHFGKLIKHFYPNKSELPESNINILEILKKHFPNLLYETKNNTVFATLPKKKEKAFNKEKKKPLITEKEAELFLLESVFNLKIE